ncbi:DUF4331 family protein [Planktosalinus lacus]|uniref:Molecular chaperone DnaK n=1 Tax=Planktosalinus lacus TaxID=1526573 RepID=A0A8J2YAI6_9FLAO|nr:DUF4331 family protein [Planktosalinus lacus]GGD97940.1 hypothetical protein GCM10011312_21910 [Planktosalinus lacus]
MKNKYLVSIAAIVLLIAGTPFLISGDHIDAPSVTGTTSDISSFYAFEGENSNNLVLIANLQGFLPSGVPTQNAEFDEDVLVEFNIDTTGDLVEDLVIQSIKRGDTMYFFGPTVPSSTGLESEIATFATINKVAISEGTTDAEAIVSENNNMKFFAGPRDDPFFFDLNRYTAILNGEVSDFNEEGEDAYAEKNVLSIAIEIPKSMLGAASVGTNPFEPTTPVYSIWVESKRKQ